MAIDESEISILVPTYKYRDRAVRAVRSALDSGAGEIIVTDDKSNDGTIEALKQFSDPRLRVLENPRNLGLWENHRHVLSLARRPWVKFIQADDFLLPGGLKHYAKAAGPGASLVWSAPVVKDASTAARSRFHFLSHNYRVGARQLFDGCVAAGWIPGSPSHMMLRSDAIERDAAVWRTSVSADLAVGAIAATRGDTVLLTHGAICQERHASQDSMTQGVHKGLTRLVSTLDYLRRRPEPELRRFADLFNAINLKPGLRTAARGFVLGEGSRRDFVRLSSRLVLGPGLTGWGLIAQEWRLIERARRFRRKYRNTITDLDPLFTHSNRLVA